MIQLVNALNAQKPISYIMLKPDGNHPEVIAYVRQVFSDNGVVEQHSFVARFTQEEAKAFYPKDDAWCVKYGQKRIDYLVKEQGVHYTGSRDALTVGRQILDQMALYLSSGPCYVILFCAEDGPKFGSGLVGATVPKDATSVSLRGRFGAGDNIEASALDSRALRNIAHSPDEENIIPELKFLQVLSGTSSLDALAVSRAVEPFTPEEK
jgi:nucleoside diphosphate kinase